MRKVLITFALMILFVGCNKNDIEKADGLLQSYSPKFGSVTKLDSVYDYQSSFEYKIKAILLRNDADSLLKQRISTLSKMKEQDMLEEMNKTAQQTKETITQMIKTAYEYDSQANSISFQKQVENEKPIFLGYKYISNNDSCSYVVYFDKPLSKILCIGKE